VDTRAIDEAGRELLDIFVDRGLIRLWPKDNPEGWVLRSSLWSPFYIDLRGLCGVTDSRQVLEKVGDALQLLIRDRVPNAQRMVAVATAGIPIATAATLRSGLPSCYTRIQPKLAEGAPAKPQYGEARSLEGIVLDGEKLVIVDDLITDGTSKIEALTAIRQEAEKRKLRLDCQDVAVLVDRGLDAEQRLARYGVRLHSLIPLQSKGLEWLEGKLGAPELETMRAYLRNPAPFQNEESRAKILREGQS
jgi:orotate phosphoribosyltransferase